MLTAQVPLKLISFALQLCSNLESSGDDPKGITQVVGRSRAAVIQVAAHSTLDLRISFSDGAREKRPLKVPNNKPVSVCKLLYSFW